MPTMMWEQRKIEHGFTPILVALGEVLEHFFFEFADMTVGVKHSPLAHACLQKSESLPFYFLHLGMSNERIGVPTLWKFDNRSFGALGCGSHIRWEYAVMQGSKFFAETIKAYGVSHLFFVPTIMIPAMAEMEEDCHHRRARTRRHFGPARWSSLNRPLKDTSAAPALWDGLSRHPWASSVRCRTDPCFVLSVTAAFITTSRN